MLFIVCFPLELFCLLTSWKYANKFRLVTFVQMFFVLFIFNFLLAFIIWANELLTGQLIFEIQIQIPKPCNFSALRALSALLLRTAKTANHVTKWTLFWIPNYIEANYTCEAFFQGIAFLLNTLLFWKLNENFIFRRLRYLFNL